MPWDLAKNSTGRNALSIRHIWLADLVSQRQLRDRMRAHGRTAFFGRHTMPQDESRGAHALRRQIRSRENPNGERGGVHDAECLQARSDPAEGKRPAKGSLAESTRTSPATQPPKARRVLNVRHEDSLPATGKPPQPRPVAWW